MIELNDQMNLNYQFTIQYEKIAFVKDYVISIIKADSFNGRNLQELVEEALDAWKLIVA